MDWYRANEDFEMGQKTYKDGEPCGHIGCLNHVKTPCEGCGRNAGKERPTAQLNFSLEVYCPHCDEEIDLTDMDHEGCYTTPIFNNKWDDLDGVTVVCPVCETEFKLGGVVY